MKMNHLYDEYWYYYYKKEFEYEYAIKREKVWMRIKVRIG